MRRSSVTSVTKNSTTERQKRVVINKSSIHAIGAFAGECIKKGDFVIEYMGEVIGSKLADQRERDYNACGIGSSYLFRIDDVCVVDATIVGNLARFLNHSCDVSQKTAPSRMNLLAQLCNEDNSV
jgi:histone-lysine N-methyltransferase SETD1